MIDSLLEELLRLLKIEDAVQATGFPLEKYTGTLADPADVPSAVAVAALPVIDTARELSQAVIVPPLKYTGCVDEPTEADSAVIVPDDRYIGRAVPPTVEEDAVAVPELRYIGFVPLPTVEVPNFTATPLFHVARSSAVICTVSFAL